MADPEIWEKQLHPDDRDRVLALDTEGRPAGEAFSADYRILARDGRVVWLHDQTIRVRGETDETAFTHGIEFDITDRKRVEQALRESEDRYRDLVETSRDLICTHALDGRILSANPWAEPRGQAKPPTRSPRVRSTRPRPRS